MRCLACDTALTDFESTRKFESGTFVDLCNRCFFSGVHEMVHTVEREDLKSVESEDEDDLSSLVQGELDWE